VLTLLRLVGHTGKVSFSLFKGFVVHPNDLVTKCMMGVLCTMPTDAPQPKIIAVSSSGLTPPGHAALPLPLKIFYSTLSIMHKDKICMERVVAHCAGWPWDPKRDGIAQEDILGEGWMARKGLPAPGSLKHVLIVRPALLTDGKCVGDEVKGTGKKPYRVSEKEFKGYTVSRKDIAHFVVDALDRWDEFENKRVNVGY
jgi:hypothetical protein